MANLLSSTPPRPVTLDDTDHALIDLLLQDGRMTNRELAAATGIGDATVGVRLRRLVADRVLIFTALFDWEAAGFEWFVVIKIGVEGRAARDVAAAVAVLPACEAVSVVFGDVDVLAFFLAADRAELHQLVETGLSPINGIASVTMDLATHTAVPPLGKQFYLARQAPPIVLPSPVIDLDDTDIEVMQALLEDGRQSSRSMARQLRVSEGTVRARIHRLTSSGLMRTVAMIEPLALGMLGVIAWVGLRVDRSAVSSVAESVRKMPQTLLTAVTVGSADVSVAIAAQDQQDMLEAVLSQLRSLPGVRSTNTLQMIDIVRFAPYMKRLT